MYKFNGESWYKAPTLLKRIRKWFIWIGGWEKANCSGWHFRHKEIAPKFPEQYEEIKGMNIGEMKDYLKDKPHRYVTTFWYNPLPISLFGHRFTIQPFGVYLRLSSEYLVFSWNQRRKGKIVFRMYRSKNGTPQDAHVWYFGTPKEIIYTAE